MNNQNKRFSLKTAGIIVILILEALLMFGNSLLPLRQMSGPAFGGLCLFVGVLGIAFGIVGLLGKNKPLIKVLSLLDLFGGVVFGLFAWIAFTWKLPIL